MMKIKDYLLVALILGGIIAVDTGHFGVYLLFLLAGIIIYKRDDIKATYCAVRPGVEYLFRGRKR